MQRLKDYKNINLIKKYVIKFSLIFIVVILTHSTLHSKEAKLHSKEAKLESQKATSETPFKQGKMVVGAIGNLYYLPDYAIGLEAFFSYLVLDNFSIGAGLGLNTDSNTYHFLMTLYGYNLFGTPIVTPTLSVKAGVGLTHDRYKKGTIFKRVFASWGASVGIITMLTKSAGISLDVGFHAKDLSFTPALITGSSIVFSF